MDITLLFRISAQHRYAQLQYKHIGQVTLPNEVTKILETEGTIQNTDQINRVEISDDENFTDNIILLPLNFYTFQNQIFVRLFDNNDLPVEVRVVDFKVNSGGGNSSTVSGEIATDDEFNEMLDDVGL